MSCEFNERLTKSFNRHKKQAETLRKRYALGEIKPWNKGLTAKDDIRIKINTDKAHASLRKKYKNDKNYRDLQVKNCKEMAVKAGLVNRNRLKGKTYEELYGFEKANEIKNKIRSKNYVLGETKCRICDVILTKDNTAEYLRKRKEKICIKCRNKLSTKNRKKKLIQYYEKIFKILGTKCIKCGFENPRALQVDHINRSGNYQRTVKFNKNLYKYYKYISELSAEELKNNYQVLCANCNWIKRHKYHESIRGKNYRSPLFIAIENVKNNILQ